MVLILFGIVKIRKGYGAEAGDLPFLLGGRRSFASLVSLECHFQPFETVSDYHVAVIHSQQAEVWRGIEGGLGADMGPEHP